MKSTIDSVDIVSFDGQDPRLVVAQRIRTDVFVNEQGVPPDIEQDGRDGAAMHVLATVNGVPMGAARIRWLSADGRPYGKAERVAVVAHGRRQGLGARMMAALESLAVDQNIDIVRLGAQADAVAFYMVLGYEPVGEPFVEAGIPHRLMEKRLSRRPV